MIDRKELERLSREQLIDLVLSLMERMALLEKEIEILRGKNSRNTSLPPSRDKQSEKRRTRSLRTKSKRRKGGQPGHKGTTLELSESVDRYKDYEVKQCSHCASDLTQVEGEVIERKQIWDIPPLDLEVVEHRRWAKQCDQCEQWSRSEYEGDLQGGPVVRYGRRWKNLVVYLSVRQMLPYRRLVETLEVLFGRKASEGTVDNIMKAKAKECTESYGQIIEQIRQSKSVGVDESGVSVEGKKNWIWTWVTSRYSLFHISNNRGSQTSKALFPDGFKKAVLISDCWKTHLNTQSKGHQICLAHIRRECQGLKEFHGSRWATKLDGILQEIFRLCRLSRIPTNRKEAVEEQLDQILSSPLLRSHKKVRTLRDRLIRLRKSITICLYDRGVMPDNNHSERAIRMIKLKNKISGTFRSYHGARRFAILGTIVDSAIKQGIHPFEALIDPHIVLKPTE